jgi:RluA family pseudouridine synthase
MERIVETRIGAELEGRPILAWLSGRFRYASEGEWFAFIESGELRVNGEKTEAGYQLKRGDLVRFQPSGIREPPARLSYRVAYEDGDFLVVDKPALLCCHPSGPFFKHSLWHLLKESGYGDPHFASRLDRETSGLLALCKTESARRVWEEARREGAIEKSYLAIVHGSFPRALDAEGWLLPDEKSALRKKRRFIADPAGAQAPSGGQSCSTSFRLRASGKGLSLVEAVLGTGRTHQIRATLLSLGFPVLGDKLYGLDENFFLKFSAGALDEADRARLVLERQALHSFGLSFLGCDGRRIELKAELPSDLLAVSRESFHGTNPGKEGAKEEKSSRPGNLPDSAP